MLVNTRRPRIGRIVTTVEQPVVDGMIFDGLSARTRHRLGLHGSITSAVIGLVEPADRIRLRGLYRRLRREGVDDNTARHVLWTAIHVGYDCALRRWS